MPAPEPGPRRRPGAGSPLLLAAVLLVALNLRGAIAAVAPVLPEIRTDLALSATTAALLTTLPVLCFATAAPAAAALARRSGLERAVLLGCAGIVAGTVVRVLDGVSVLLAGTLLLGLSMTIGNVVVPVVAKRDFPDTAGRVMGLYTAALAAGAAVAAAATAPLADVWGWRPALASWAVLAVLAVLLWQVATRTARRAAAAGTGAHGLGGPATTPRLWRSPVAWSVALFLGCQSTSYYSVTAWLPTLLADDAGLDLATAGAAMSLFQLVGIAGTLAIPMLVTRRPNQGWLGGLVAAGWVVTLTGLLVWPTAWVAWAVTGGLTQGAGISFAFTVLVLRAHDADAARALSSMTQLVGYSLGAAGPVVVGGLYAATGGWTAPLLLLLLAAGGVGAFAQVAGRNTTVGAPRSRPAGG